MKLVCRPLVDWPGQLRANTERKPAQFSAAWSQTVQLLEREADLLGATEVVLQLAVAERDLRLDGWIRANATPSHPGVTLVLPESNQGRVSFSTDRYSHAKVWRPGGYETTPGWQCNVRALALSMEALRAADRHGVMQGRQYAGFRELGSGIAMGAGTQQMTVESAARFVAKHTGDPRAFDIAADLLRGLDGELDAAYRRAAKRLHPDAGGDPALFVQLEQAKEILERHGGGAG